MIRLDPHGLDVLLDTLEDVRRQGSSCLRYASDEVCRPDGFETSEVCLLSPLGHTLRVVAERVAAAAREIDDWFGEVDLAIRETKLRFADTDAVHAISWQEPRT